MIAHRVALTKAYGLGRLCEVAAARLGWVEVDKIVLSLDLPSIVLGQKDQFISQRDVLLLHQAFAIRAGDPLNGIYIGSKMEPEDLGHFARLAMAEPDALSMMRTFVRLLKYHQNAGEMIIERSDKELLWGYRLAVPLMEGRAAHADHVIALMIKAVRSYISQDWDPTRVELESCHTSPTGRHEDRYRAPVWFDAQYNAIVLPIDLIAELVCKKQWAEAVPSSNRLSVQDWQQLPDDLAGAVRELIALQIDDSSVNVKMIAQKTNRSVRHLQRQLKETGYSFRQLVIEYRVEKAKALIGQTSLAITDIALSLGYADAPQFGRLFKRFVGQSPTEFRRQMR